MAKALLGTHMTGRQVALQEEVRALRNRVAKLEAELADAELVRDELLRRAAADADVLDLELAPATA